MSRFTTKRAMVIGLLLVICVGLGLGIFFASRIYSPQTLIAQALEGKTVNILFMGIDARKTESNSRSDTMLVASIDIKTQKTVLISIPRDTRIKNKSGRYVKINSINVTEGPDGACQAVSELIGINITDYVVTNFAGFEEIIDTLGGVNLDIKSDMHHADPIDPSLAIDLHKGYQQLSGKDALAYVRFRGGPTADIGRTERQQEFLKALADQMFQAKTILKLPALIPQLSENIHTNIALTDMIYLANVIKDFQQPLTILSQTLPGYPYTAPKTGESFWLADADIANGIVDSLLSGQTFGVTSKAPDWIKKEAAAAAQQKVTPDTITATPDEATANPDESTNIPTETADIPKESAEDSPADTEQGQEPEPVPDPNGTDGKDTLPPPNEDPEKALIP